MLTKNIYFFALSLMLSHIPVHKSCIVYIKINKKRNKLFILAKTSKNHKH